MCLDTSNTAAPTSSTPSGAKQTKPKVKKNAPVEKINFSGGDQCLATTVNFIRMTFWYLEMCAAVAEGDIGRVFEIIKVRS